MKLSISAVIVTFNRKILLIECLESLLSQTYPLDSIILIDNASSSDTPQLLFEKGYIKEEPQVEITENWNSDYEILSYTHKHKINVNYIRLLKNTGGAGGFHEGIKRAYEKGCDWIWVMDDDAEPAADALENLLSFENKENASFLAPRVIHKNIPGHTEYYHHKTKIDLLSVKEYNLKNSKLQDKFYPLEANGFVGPLLNSKAITSTSIFPDKSFFIWWDDTDYTYALYKKFGHGFLITDAIIYHKDPVSDAYNRYDWKTIFGARNRIRFFKKHCNPIGKIILTIKSIILYFKLRRFFKAKILMKVLFLELINNTDLTIEEAKNGNLPT
jgi:rhamnopyranosyl-N-acetylglucosaminyl-diphospho-decaprenol beta-1,3/1,4-galactofuranosyltransferase